MNQEQTVLPIRIQGTPIRNLLRVGWIGAVGLALIVLSVMASNVAWAEAARNSTGGTLPPVSTLKSDDFNQCTLDTRWQYIDPLGDSIFEVNGEQIAITVPAGVAHDIWEGNRNAPRLMQSVNNADFEAEVKFESPVTRRYQLQGLIAEADADNLLRVNFQSDGTDTHLVIVSFSGGDPKILADEIIVNGAPLYLRLRRVGTQWTVSYSYDGSTWQSPPSLQFEQSLNLAKIGPFVGNAGPSPVHTGIIDYFFNTASPISPEDPVVNTIPVNVVGNGRVDKSCGTPLTLTAVPAPGWNFSQWSGSLTGSQNPGTLAITGSEVVTATFVPKPLALDVQVNGGGEVQLTPDQLFFDNGDVVTLTAIPNRGWVFDSWGGAVSGTEVSKVLTMDSNKTVVANFRLLSDNSNIVSDDFNVCELDGSRWTYTDPVGDAEMVMNGSQIKIAIPGEAAHDVWDNGIGGPHLMQAASDKDFSIETKFDSAMDKRYQMQGILIKEDAQNFLRINFQHHGSGLYAFAASFNNGAPRKRFEQALPDGAPMYLRVVRAGHSWSVFYSFDGETWDTNSTMTFNYVMNVSQVGVFVGNAGTEVPAHTGIIDYFFNSASPIAPEDPVVNALPPITIIGQGTVNRSPACGNPVELTAVPAANWRFGGWSGDLTGTQNPATVTALGTERITANFVPVSGIQSDDFSSCDINPAWTFINPKNDATFTRVENQKISIALPADVEHDIYPLENSDEPLIRAPRLMQPATDVDFELEAKFESALNGRYQLQGLLVQQDANNLLRINYQHNGVALSLVAIGFVDKTPKTYLEAELILNTPMYLRVNRTGDNWTVEYSANGTDWTEGGSFTHALNVSQVGIFAGNAGRNPAHTAIVDYFFETRNRISPEDGGGNQLTVTTDGNGSVNKTPDKTVYGCGEQVELNATAAQNWTFTGWSGGLTGSQNPATVTMDVSRTITAIFKENKYSLTVTTEGGDGGTPGTTTALVNGSAAGGPYYEGQKVMLKATPAAGYQFVKWVSGTTEFAEAEIEVTVTSSTTYTAVFAKTGSAGYTLYMPLIAR